MPRPSPCWLTLLAALAGCGPEPLVQAPSDDPADWQVDTSIAYTPVLGEPSWLIPSRLLPREARPVMASNNNVAIALHQDRLFLAWRTSELHFASANTRMHLISSPDRGQSWTHETTFALGADVREPLFLSMGGHLRFFFFEAGVDLFAFEPKALWRTERTGPATWSEREPWGEPGEITWDLKLRGGRALRTSYRGNHYELSRPSDISLLFTASNDGLSWSPLGGDGVVYRGGASEAAFELAEDGSLWAVTRNEDGDDTGFGSHVCTAPADDLGAWTCSARSDPERYDSPKMFRHGHELYLVARRDLGGPFDEGRTDLSLAERKQKYLGDYWARPKRTSLYRIDQEARKVVWVFDLPSAGDTALPSVIRTGAHSFLVANYTSPLDDPDRSWVTGQTSAEGTAIYLITLDFVPR